MNVTTGFINAPVMKIDPDKGGDERSKEEKKKQLERRLPRMRTSEKYHSEKILADAMQTNTEKNATHTRTDLPRPAVLKISQDQPYQQNDKKQIHFDKSTYLQRSLSDIEERLQSRQNQSSASEALSILQKIVKNFDKTTSDALLQKPNLVQESINAQKLDVADLSNKSESAEMKSFEDHSELLCSLDFIEGYAGTLHIAPEMSAEMFQALSGIRSLITNQSANLISSENWQTAGIRQVGSDTVTQCVVYRDTLGRQQVDIKVSEEAKDKLPSALRSSNIKENRQNSDNGERRKMTEISQKDDTLPLFVQRSI